MAWQNRGTARVGRPTSPEFRFGTEATGGMNAATLCIWIALVFAGTLLSACSTNPDAADAAAEAGIAKAHLRLARVEKPAGDPGNIVTGPTLDYQKQVLQLYQDALYEALTTGPANSGGGANCANCPVLSSRILSFSENLGGIPARANLAVLFKLSSPDHGPDPFWWKIISKQGSSINFSGAVRVRHARTEPLTEVLKELVGTLPADARSGS